MSHFRPALHSGSGGGDDDEDYIDPDYWSYCTGRYTTFDQREGAKDDLPAHSVEQYMLDVEISNYEGALKEYKGLMDDGYDKKFGIYEKYSRMSAYLFGMFAARTDPAFALARTKYRSKSITSWPPTRSTSISTAGNLATLPAAQAANASPACWAALTAARIVRATA